MRLQYDPRAKFESAQLFAHEEIFPYLRSLRPEALSTTYLALSSPSLRFEYRTRTEGYTDDKEETERAGGREKALDFAGFLQYGAFVCGLGLGYIIRTCLGC